MMRAIIIVVLLTPFTVHGQNSIAELDYEIDVYVIEPFIQSSGTLLYQKYANNMLPIKVFAELYKAHAENEFMQMAMLAFVYGK